MTTHAANANATSRLHSVGDCRYQRNVRLTMSDAVGFRYKSSRCFLKPLAHVGVRYIERSI